MKYRVTFTGRKVGAIGIFQAFTVEVEANNAKDALMKVYDTHEHVRSAIIRVIPQETT